MSSAHMFFYWLFGHLLSALIGIVVWLEHSRSAGLAVAFLLMALNDIRLELQKLNSKR